MKRAALVLLFVLVACQVAPVALAFNDPAWDRGLMLAERRCRQMEREDGAGGYSWVEEMWVFESAPEGYYQVVFTCHVNGIDYEDWEFFYIHPY